MSFLSPWTALLAAAVAVPLLVLLYLLRLRRQRMSVASTLLWRQAYEDLQVNVPFQRLRWSVLLLLQLLALMALLLALADPTIEAGAVRASRVVIVIDRSASMNALMMAGGEGASGGADNQRNADESARTRLDAAKAAALEMIESLFRSGAGNDGRGAFGGIGGVGGGGGLQVMVVAFGRTAQVVSTFTSDRRALRAAVHSIGPSDEEANLDAALQLAAAFAGGSGEDAAGDGSAGADAPADVVLLSDGGVDRIGATSDHALRAGRFRFVQVVPDAEGRADPQSEISATADLPAARQNPKSKISANVGIAAFSVRRDYDDPARVLIFARLVNAGAAEIETAATLLVNGAPAASLLRRIPAASEDGPGETTLTHALDLAEGAVITLRLSGVGVLGGMDLLAADDVAALVLPPPARPRIALVYPGGQAGGGSRGSGGGGAPDPYLHDLLEALEPQSLVTMTADAYAAIDPRQIDARARFDLIVFDRVSGQRLPGVPSITFGAAPAGVETIDRSLGASGAPSPSHPLTDSPSQTSGRRILSWERQHPVMRGVELDTIVYTGFTGYELPAASGRATPLAFGQEGPVIAVLPTRGARHVLVGFALAQSNWPLHVSSAVFLQNALDYLTLADPGQDSGGAGSGGGAGGGAGIVYRPGEPITVRARIDARELVIEGPVSLRVRANEDEDEGAAAGGWGAGLVTLPPLRLAGLYRVQGAAAPHEQIAVSVLSDVESDIRPRSAVRVNAEEAAARSASAAAPRPLWPWLVAAAFALLALEWLVYCRKVR